MADFVVLNTGYHRSLHLGGIWGIWGIWRVALAATGEAQFASRRLRWPSSRRAACPGTCLTSPRPACYQPCYYYKWLHVWPYRCGSALLTTASSPGHPGKETQFKNSH